MNSKTMIPSNIMMLLQLVLLLGSTSMPIEGFTGPKIITTFNNHHQNTLPIVSKQQQFVPIQQYKDSKSTAGSSSTILYNSIGDDSKKDDEIERLRTMAAKLRAEAAVLEAQQLKSMADAAERVFLKFDTNQDGTVSVDELKIGLEREFKTELSDKRVKQLLDDFDKTGDGLLQLDEFVTIDKFRNRLDQLARDEKVAVLEAEKAAQREEEVSKFLEAQIALINDRPATMQDRLVSVLPYLFPLLDGLQFGKYLILSNPENPLSIGLALIYTLYRAIPFGGLIAFFTLNFLSNNPSLNRLIRFNMQQAIFIDIALFFPGLIGALLALVGGTSIPLAVDVIGNDILFVSLLLMVAYSVTSSLLGITPNQIPIISNSVESRMPPTIDMFDEQGRFKKSSSSSKSNDDKDTDDKKNDSK